MTKWLRFSELFATDMIASMLKQSTLENIAFQGSQLCVEEEQTCSLRVTCALREKTICIIKNKPTLKTIK